MTAEPDLRALLADRAGTLVLAQTSTATEAELIRAKLAASGGTSRTLIDLPPLSNGSAASAALQPALMGSDDALQLVPVRVAWLPEEHAGQRTARLTDLVPGQDPYHPSDRQQRRIISRQPDRAVVLVGEPATVGELRQRWAATTGGGEPAGFAAYVARRATLTLDRAEYRLLGPRYKTPSLVRDEILSSARFRSGLAGLQDKNGKPATLDEASQILDELVAGWSRRLIDIVPASGRLVYRMGFDPRIDYDEAQVGRLRAAMRDHPGILLWSHRSNLDTLVLSAAMQEHGLPPAHLFAGINMAFGPMGAIMRRAGVIFIRRVIGDDPLYKYALKEYVGYVLEKRFNLSWSIEGTRSRTGKMLPPKLGLLSYAADAYLDGRTDDILLLPVSITFDQLHEIAEYADYARGGQKRPEGFGWLYRFVKAQGARHYGQIYVRFGEPVSLRAFLGPPGGRTATDPAARKLGLQKTAFEVAWRINQGMPVTATAIICAILLAMHGTALTFEEIRLGLVDALAYLEQRDIPRTASAAALATPEGVRATLDALSQGGPVSCSAAGREPVWFIGPDQQLGAAFYRNSLIHFMLDTALCELALLSAAETSAAESQTAETGAPGPVAAFWAEVARLRDLLKFEFYFTERDAHREQVAAEMARHDPAWEQRLTAGPDSIRALLASMRPLVSHIVLRPFIEAYRIVADVLAADGSPIDDAQVVQRSLGLGRQYVAQRRLRSTEPVSVLLFQTGLQLARNQGLAEPARDDPAVDNLLVRRQAFLAELRALLRQLSQIEELAVQRYLTDAVTAWPPE